MSGRHSIRGTLLLVGRLAILAIEVREERPNDITASRAGAVRGATRS